MPITKQAIKKLRHDRKITVRNKKAKSELRKAIKITRAEKLKKNLSSVYSKIDKAAKKGLIHKKKASRLKSRLARKKTT